MRQHRILSKVWKHEIIYTVAESPGVWPWKQAERTEVGGGKFLLQVIQLKQWQWEPFLCSSLYQVDTPNKNFYQKIQNHPIRNLLENKLLSSFPMLLFMLHAYWIFWIIRYMASLTPPFSIENNGHVEGVPRSVWPFLFLRDDIMGNSSHPSLCFCLVHQDGGL